MSRHAVATINLNVSRLSETFKDSKSLEKMKEFLSQRKKIELSQIDHFQAIICRDPKLDLGADDSTHTQITYLDAQKFDAATIGEQSGYRLTESKIGQWKAYLGRKDREGSWGAIPVNDRTLVFGVTRMLESIVESQKMEFPAAHKLDELQKSNVDFCITVSGGKPIAEVFANSWGTDQYSSTFELLDRGLIYFDAQSEKALVGVFHATDEQAAIQLETEIAKLVELGHSAIKFFRSPMEKQLESMKEKNSEHLQSMAGEIQPLLDLLDETAKTLDSLEISRDGSQITLVSRETENLKAIMNLIARDL